MGNSENEMGNNQEKAFYEIGFLLRPELTELEVSQEVSKIEKILTELEGERIEEELPKLIKLAYPIEKKESAFFGYIIFKMPSKEVALIPERLKFEKNILRYLVIKRSRESLAMRKEEQKKPRRKVRKEVRREEKIDESKLEKKLEEILK